MRRMQAPAAKIIAGLKDAIAGDFERVTIDGHTWVRADVHDHFMAQRNALLATLKRIIDEPINATEAARAAIALAETERT